MKQQRRQEDNGNGKDEEFDRGSRERREGGREMEGETERARTISMPERGQEEGRKTRQKLVPV